jgi:hypothetical protein
MLSLCEELEFGCLPWQKKREDGRIKDKSFFFETGAKKFCPNLLIKKKRIAQLI